MKKFLIALSVLTALLCSSCGLFGDQRYECDIDKVASIQIVRLDEYVEEEYRYEYTVLSQISDCEAFVSRLNKLDHSVNWGDPRQMDIGYIVIRIGYSNGDFDEIHQDAQCFNKDGVNRYGFFFFDDAQFDSLISDYIKG